MFNRIFLNKKIHPCHVPHAVANILKQINKYLKTNTKKKNWQAEPRSPPHNALLNAYGFRHVRRVRKGAAATASTQAINCLHHIHIPYTVRRTVQCVHNNVVDIRYWNAFCRFVCTLRWLRTLSTECERVCVLCVFVYVMQMHATCRQTNQSCVTNSDECHPIILLNVWIA